MLQPEPVHFIRCDIEPTPVVVDETRSVINPPCVFNAMKEVGRRMLEDKHDG
jgi:hypothetical protein